MTPRTAGTLLAVFARRAEEESRREAVLVKRDGKYAAVTWGELARDVRLLAAALSDRGVLRGDRVVQISENRYEWIVCDLACQAVQAVHTPLHASLSGGQLVWQIAHAQARVVLFSGEAILARLRGTQAAALRELSLIAYDPLTSAVATGEVQLLADLLAEADEGAGDELLQSALNDARPDDLATILYTSGTTGEPKGVMLSLGNLYFNARGTVDRFAQKPEDVKLNFLPLSHIFARTCDFYTWLVGGSTLGLAASRETVLEDCQAVRPTMLNGVPYFFDKVARSLVHQGLDQREGALAAALGGRIELCCSGGAALADSLCQFYCERGVPLRQGYGLSETSPVITLSSKQEFRLGTVGRALDGVELRIEADGEVLTRGPHVMQGYWRDPEATAEVHRGEWLATGDLGELDADGYLRITGRKKEIIATAGGKKIAPALLESLLTQDPLIAQAMVVGEGRKYLVALIVPQPDALRAEIVARGIAVSSAQEALAHDAVRSLYEALIRSRLAGLSPYEQVQKFALLDRAFSQEHDELTPKLSLRRAVIQQHFADAIARLYGE